LSIHETLTSDRENCAVVVWLHVGFIAVVAIACLLVSFKLLQRFHELFQQNRRWARSTLARRSLRVDGLVVGQPCEQVAAELLETLRNLSTETKMLQPVSGQRLGNIFTQVSQSAGVGSIEPEPDDAFSQEPWSITDIEVVPEQRQLDALMIQREELMMQLRSDTGNWFKSNARQTKYSYVQEIEEIDGRISSLSTMRDRPVSSGVVFISFATVEQAECCLLNSVAGCRNYSFRRAPEPSEIIWKSLHTTDAMITFKQWFWCPLLLVFLLLLVCMPLGFLVFLTATKLAIVFQALPTLFLAAFNMWFLPVVTYRLVRKVGHHRISSIELHFFLTFSIALLVSSFGMTTIAHVLVERFLAPSTLPPHQLVDEASQALGLATWLVSPGADAFYAEYLVMGIVVFTALQILQLQATQSVSAGSAHSSEVGEESELFLSGRNAYLMPVHATDTKGYQYAVYIHIFYITCGFGARAPCIVLFGALLSGVKYLSDKVAQFRFFSDPVSQMQVRPRFLRRGGQYVTLAAIKSLALSLVVIEVLFGMTLASYRPLPFSAEMAG